MAKKYVVQTQDRVCKDCEWCKPVTEKHKLGADGQPFIGDCTLGVTPFLRLIKSDGCLERDREKAIKALDLPQHKK